MSIEPTLDVFQTNIRNLRVIKPERVEAIQIFELFQPGIRDLGSFKA